MFDVAVIGGGPAGSSAAIHLAAAGARVVVLDGSHPREKPCGGGITGRALALVDSTVATLEDGVGIDTATFAFAGRQAPVSLAVPGQARRLAVVSRATFDRWLLARAAAAGAEVRGSRVVDVAPLGGGWRVVTRERDVEARWLIGADGPGSLVRRRVSRPFDRADLSVASGYYVRGTTAPAIDIAFVEAPPGYLWAFPRADHLAVGTCAQADVTNPTEMRAITSRWLDAAGHTGTREPYSWPIPSLRAATLRREQPAGPGWILVGDAAGLVDPITREGIFFAIASGQQAAAAIARAKDPSLSYAERLRDTIYGELILAAELKARFYRPAFMSLLIKALQRSDAIRGIMADLVAGEQSYHTLRRRLLGSLEWRLMLELAGLAHRA